MMRLQRITGRKSQGIPQGCTFAKPSSTKAENKKTSGEEEKDCKSKQKK